MPRLILTVDDSAAVRAAVGGTLAAAGYTVIAKVDGVEALDFARLQCVDLVLTDLHMPRMDGLALVRALRALPGYRHTPLLMLTTESSPRRQAQGRAAGADVWIVKPFDPQQLLATIARLL